MSLASLNWGLSHNQSLSILVFKPFCSVFCVCVLVCLFSPFPLFLFSPGCGCGGTGRQTQSHHWFSDAHHAGAAGARGESRAGDRGVHPGHAHPRGLRHPAQKPQLRRLNTRAHIHRALHSYPGPRLCHVLIRGLIKTAQVSFFVFFFSLFVRFFVLFLFFKVYIS